MAESFFSLFDKLTKQLNEEINNQKQNARNALNMENWDEAQNIIKNSTSNVSVIKNWISKLNELKSDIEQSKLIDENVNFDSNEDKSEVTIETKNNDLIEEKKIIKEKNDTKTAELSEKQIKNTIIQSNNNVWLNLNEDFTSKKVKAVLFDNRVYNVKDLTDALVLICELLYQLDKDKFIKMMNASFVYGNTVKYLSKTKYKDDENKFKKLNKVSVYVWTNTQSNNKTNFISNMLKYYDLPLDYVKLSCKDGYSPKKRNVSSYEKDVKKKELDKSEIIEDDKEYTKPIVSSKNSNTNKQAEKNPSNDILIDDKTDMVSFCEELILKYPYKMICANLNTELNNIFTDSQITANVKMTSPKKLSNGLWVETNNITSAIKEKIKNYCQLN